MSGYLCVCLAARHGQPRVPWVAVTAMAPRAVRRVVWVPACATIISVPDLPGLSRDFDCFDFILEWDGMSGMEVVFDSLIFAAF